MGPSFDEVPIPFYRVPIPYGLCAWCGASQITSVGEPVGLMAFGLLVQVGVDGNLCRFRSLLGCFPGLVDIHDDIRTMIRTSVVVKKKAMAYRPRNQVKSVVLPCSTLFCSTFHMIAQATRPGISARAHRKMRSSRRVHICSFLYCGIEFRCAPFCWCLVGDGAPDWPCLWVIC